MQCSRRIVLEIAGISVLLYKTLLHCSSCCVTL